MWKQLWAAPLGLLAGLVMCGLSGAAMQVQSRFQWRNNRCVENSLCGGSESRCPHAIEHSSSYRREVAVLRDRHYRPKQQPSSSACQYKIHDFHLGANMPQRADVLAPTRS